MEDKRMKMILDHIQTFKGKDLKVDMDKFNTLCNIVKLSEKICSDYDEIKIDFNEESIACVVTSYVFMSFEGEEKEIVREILSLCDDIQFRFDRLNYRAVVKFIINNYLV